jgi:hypothetical protein
MSIENGLDSGNIGARVFSWDDSEAGPAADRRGLPPQEGRPFDRRNNFTKMGSRRWFEVSLTSFRTESPPKGRGFSRRNEVSYEDLRGPLWHLQMASHEVVIIRRLEFRFLREAPFVCVRAAGMEATALRIVMRI